jgi:hypothetical protein
MAAPSPREVTGLLLAWSEGEQTAFEKLDPLVYAEPRRVGECIRDLFPYCGAILAFGTPLPEL